MKLTTIITMTTGSVHTAINVASSKIAVRQNSQTEMITMDKNTKKNNNQLPRVDGSNSNN